MKKLSDDEIVDKVIEIITSVYSDKEDILKIIDLFEKKLYEQNVSKLKVLLSKLKDPFKEV